MKGLFFSNRLIAVCLCTASLFWCNIFAQTKYSIYPIPQQITQGSRMLTLTQTVHICAEIGIDEATQERAKSILTNAGYNVTLSSDTVQHQTNLILGVHNSGGIADKYGQKQSVDRSVFISGANKFDPHIIYVLDEQPSPRILILGANTDCVFYGLATLEQMVEQSPTNELSNASIHDYSYQEIRGFVEGFYGFPWYIQDKISLMRYAMRFKMNCYIYGPKSDPYHLGYWKSDYPTSLTADQKHRGWISQNDLRNLSQESNATKVRFVWAAHPALQNGINFQTTAGADQGVTDLMKKFDHLYKLGVRDFGVFVDDISVDDAVRDRVQQKHLMNQLYDKLTEKYNITGVDPADTIRPLHFVPTPYPISWGSATQRKEYFDEIKQIHPSIRIYHTGWGVWSSIEKNPFITNNAECDRITSMWWNYPCNDDGHNKMKMGPINQLFSVDKSITQAQGVVANPMSQPQCSKVAFFGLADYCWNTPKFDAKKNWGNSFASLIPDNENLRKALRLFALHSSENKEPQSFIEMYNSYKNTPLAENPLVTSRLLKEIDSIRWAYTELQQLKSADKEDYRLMYRDIRPWLNKLNSMAEVIANTIAGQQETSDPQKRVNYFTRANLIYRDLETNPDHQLEKLMGYGTGASIEITSAIPSNVEMRSFSKYIQEKGAKAICKEIPLVAKQELFSSLGLLTGCTLVNESGIAALNANGFVLLPGQSVGINLNQLKRIESVEIHDEVASQVEMQYSVNGKEWFGFIPGDVSPYAAFIRLYNGQAINTTLVLNKTRFAVSFAALPKIVGVTQNTTAGIHQGTIGQTYDGDRSTFLWTNGKQVAGDRFTFDLGKATPIHDVTVTFNANDRPGEARIQASLKSASGYQQIGESMSYSTMDQSGDNYTHTSLGDGSPSQFVQLYITKPFEYWIRFAEIEINKLYMDASTLSQDVNDQGRSIKALSDRNMITSYKPNFSNRYIDYFLIRNERTQTVDVYQNLDVIEGKQAPKVSAYSEHKWIELGDLNQSITTFDVSGLANLQKIRITWKEGEAPSLYEIIEKGTTNNEEILDIENVIASHRVKVCIDGETVAVFADRTIERIRQFDVFGREIGQHIVNALSSQFSSSTSQKISFVQVFLSDGTVQTVKCVTQK